MLAYQSQFGKGKWLKPATEELCNDPAQYFCKSKPVVFVPLSFSSDHIETLFEIEELYVGSLRSQGFLAYRCPALGRRKDWVDAMVEIIQGRSCVANDSLIR
jgi:ferrochelatase